MQEWDAESSQAYAHQHNIICGLKQRQQCWQHRHNIATNKMPSSIPHFCISVCISAASYVAASIVSGRNISIIASTISIGISISGRNTNNSNNSNNKSSSINKHVGRQEGGACRQACMQVGMQPDGSCTLKFIVSSPCNRKLRWGTLSRISIPKLIAFFTAWYPRWVPTPSQMITPCSP